MYTLKLIWYELFGEPARLTNMRIYPEHFPIVFSNEVVPDEWYEYWAQHNPEGSPNSGGHMFVDNSPMFIFIAR